MTQPILRSQRPNVILVMCDQWRPDCLGVLGHPLVRTPNLDALAARGVLFENAYCASPVCSPARASWLTGLYAHAHGQYVNFGKKAKFVCELRPECVTLGDSFKSAGYRCGIVGPWHLGRDHEPQHGFEEYWHTYQYQGKGRPDRLVDYFAREGVANLYDKSGRSGSERADTIDKMVHTVLADPRQQRTTWTVDRGCEFIGVAQKDPRPFFLFLSVKDPHPPIVVPPELMALYPREQMPRPQAWHDPAGTRPRYHVNAHERLPANIRDEDFQTLVSRYFAVMTHVDREMGRMLAFIDRAGLGQDTVVAFISDHGEMLGEQGFVGKRRFFEPAVRVPCIVSWPGTLPSGLRVKTPLAGVDLAPTLLELAGVSTSSPIDGRSVAQSVLASQQPPPRPVFAELATQEVHTGETQEMAGLGGHVMVRDGEWKYVWSQFDLDELYNLTTDPGERSNLSADPAHSSRIRSLRETICAMLRHTGPGVYRWCVDRMGKA